MAIYKSCRRLAQNRQLGSVVMSEIPTSISQHWQAWRGRMVKVPGQAWDQVGRPRTLWANIQMQKTPLTTVYGLCMGGISQLEASRLPKPGRGYRPDRQRGYGSYRSMG
ncbi:hypothetical protein Bbelb_009760 [Branchiostoma belcheri]|nr:hypothetical protein Bbelb_009760 [Branchiostoma belcheri]